MGDYRNWYETNFKYVEDKKVRSSFLKAFVTKFARITALIFSWLRSLHMETSQVI